LVGISISIRGELSRQITSRRIERQLLKWGHDKYVSTSNDPAVKVDPEQENLSRLRGRGGKNVNHGAPQDAELRA